jgi:hypothetical protein
MKRILLLTVQAVVTLYLPTLALAQLSPDNAQLMQRIHSGLSQLYGRDFQNVSIKQARSGDIASGVEVASTDDKLAIDVTPCSLEKIIITFVSPYRKTTISRAQCGDPPYPRVQVIQYVG